MSAAAWFLTGWLSASVFIAIGIWLHYRWKCTTRMLDELAHVVPDTTAILADYPGARR